MNPRLSANVQEALAQIKISGDAADAIEQALCTEDYARKKRLYAEAGEAICEAVESYWISKAREAASHDTR
jgi:histone H3/H4